MAIFEDDGSYDALSEYSYRPIRWTRRKCNFIDDDISPEDLQNINDFFDAYAWAYNKAFKDTKEMEL